MFVINVNRLTTGDKKTVQITSKSTGQPWEQKWHYLLPTFSRQKLK